MPLDLSPAHRRIVLDILCAVLPADREVWIFGSRATGRARRYSDLDLAIDITRQLTLDESAGLREAFEESDLHYRVDIVDWQAIDERFRKLIAAHRLPLRETTPPPAGSSHGAA